MTNDIHIIVCPHTDCPDSFARSTPEEVTQLFFEHMVEDHQQPLKL